MVSKDQVAGVARQTEAEGTADKIAGKVQKAYGDVKDKVNKAL
ncbi:CsbD family protein [Mesorhizobium sp. PL10]